MIQRQNHWEATAHVDWCRWICFLFRRFQRIAIVFVMALGNAFTAPVFYTVRTLDVLPGHFASGGQAINNRGQVAGVSSGYVPDLTGRAVRYTNGTGIQDLGVLPGRTDSGSSDINDSGQVTGFSWEVDVGHMRAFRYTDGMGMQDLGLLPGDFESSGFGINDFGQVTGYSANSTGFARAIRYTDGVGMQDLGRLPGRPNSQGLGINNLGQVTGVSYGQASQRTTFRYTDGVGMQDLGVLPGDTYSYGQAINNRGQVVGISGQFGQLRAFRFTDGLGMQDLGVLPDSSRAGGVNEAGDAVFSVDPTGRHPRGFLYTDKLGRFVDLNTLLPPDSGWVLRSASDINNRGQITGQGLLNGESRGFVLTPVPEPRTTTLLAIGLLAMAGLAGRRPRTREHK